jgi:choline dehydrogenase-like flavoprotein
MILDSETRADDWFRDRIFDVCIIGSGPAGVTLARRLATRGLSVGLFEGGGESLTEESQELYQGTTAGQPYYALDAARLRFFGGSSNHWGGWTRPLDEYDFTPKAHSPLSGWPIAKADLDPHAAEADEILDLPANRPPPDVLPADHDTVVPRLFRFSRPVTRFGEKYRAELAASGNIRVHLNASLVDLRVNDGATAVTEAMFRSYKRNDLFSVRARAFALCLGGLENPRALLNATSQVGKGLGNERDLVGRYFLEHPHAPIGRIVMRQPMTWMLVYSPTPQLMDREKVLNFGVRLGHFDEWNGGDFTGALQPQPECRSDFDTLLAAEMKGEPTACPAYVGDAFVSCEQSLEPGNRVRLTSERDKFGLRRIELDWSLSDTDIRTLQTAATTVGRLLAARDAGRLKVVDWLTEGQRPNLDQLWGGNHHMGTTRMSADASTGVVDANLKIHSLANLYVGGSSTFATSGHANPTYTIVQLSLRLGDHLAGLVGRG